MLSIECFVQETWLVLWKWPKPKLTYIMVDFYDNVFPGNLANSSTSRNSRQFMRLRRRNINLYHHHPSIKQSATGSEIGEVFDKGNPLAYETSTHWTRLHKGAENKLGTTDHINITDDSSYWFRLRISNMTYLFAMEKNNLLTDG